MLRVVRTTRSTMSDRFSGDIEQELHETLRRNRLKRARAQFIAEFFDDEELEEINRGRGRHSFSRPGGGNSGGRPDNRHGAACSGIRRVPSRISIQVHREHLETGSVCHTRYSS